MASGLYFTLLCCLSCGLLTEANKYQFPPVKVPGCSCPDGWSRYEDRCFMFVNKEQEWTDAEASCMNEGGHLASFHNKGEYDFMRQTIQSAAGSDATTWAGGCDAAKNGVWLWSDGSKFEYTHWGSGEPNNAGGNENCMEINFQGRDYVNDTKCSLKRPFLCAKDLHKCFSCP